jgi:hypothetical protein
VLRRDEGSCGIIHRLRGALRGATAHDAAHDGTGIFKLDDSGRAVFKPNRKGTLGPTFVVQAWFKQANLALAQLKDAASNFIFMAGPPRVEAR